MPADPDALCCAAGNHSGTECAEYRRQLCITDVLFWDLHVSYLASPEHSSLDVTAERGKGGKSPCSGNMITQ